MKRVSTLIRCDGEFDKFVSCLESTFGADEPLPIAVNGLTAGAETAFVAECIIEARRIRRVPTLVFVEGESEREKLASALTELGLNVRQYKKRDLIFHNIRASHDVDRERLSVLSELISGADIDAVITTPSAAALVTVPPSVLLRLSLTLSVGTVISFEDLCMKFASLGFAEVQSVDGKGQFSRRGGIIDFWGGESDMPVRAEFFGDEVDRLAYFDPISQRAEAVCESVSILPAGEVIIDSEARDRLLSAVSKLERAAKDSVIREKLARERAVLEGGTTVDFRDKYIGLIYGESNLFSYFDELCGTRAITLCVGSAGALEDIKKSEEFYLSERESMLSSGLVSADAATYTAGASGYKSFLDKNVCVHINAFSGGIGTTKLSGLFGFRCRRTVSYGENMSMLREDMASLRRGMYRILLLCENRAGAESLIGALASDDIAATPIYDTPEFDISRADGGRVFVGIGGADGFDLIVPKIAVLSMKRDTGRAVMSQRKRQRILRSAGGSDRLMSYADLSVGDYVVHANYGIGLFEGIETVTLDGVTKDYITIKYAGTDKLFVPCDRLEMIGKYIGERDKDGKVKLSKMGGTEWHKTRSRAKGAARDIAKKLIALYAERHRRPGYAFPADCDLEYAFADSFEYEETESQTQAISEIKADMMRPEPMNRLLCGDVGFGKTEVALRAAFKAIMGGKQVAILVPTTILAMQHYQTTLSRMSGYPVNVEMLTRFKKPKEQAEILRKVKRGETDILIGTHKLLSKQLEFSDLGLLIIDEEQRFGVAQKEKLKEMAKNVDTLTLTATPIPRTLNMAMSGISDISLLDEAPGERRPVQTYVLEHDELIIFDAIRKELARGGQTLYIYNKVEDISFVASRIMHELPDARVAYAHGQMEKDELEDIWQMLVRGEIDILVCTTIIETGVDLPSANTLIIENADRFGLAQLHQIRGRVGRSERQAYAYLTFRPGKALSEVAEKRLTAIKEYAEFGAGYKIALRDLEIRGAGNLLGAEQHGYIESVGYDLYVKLLNEAVLEERGEKIPERTEALIDMRVSAHIPESYIPSSADRMEMYKKISLIKTTEDKDDVYDEIVDRFGNMPRAVERLLLIALSKAICEEVGIELVEEKAGTITFVTKRPRLDLWSELFDKYRGMRFAPSGDRIIYKYGARDSVKCMCEILESYKSFVKD
ncbi:MAG: transcription-repair coupling factor [Clostridia bacterium]|nr:transcription-repair coupling factor [Clostridia bacterium]